jgi:hypothetical protein
VIRYKFDPIEMVTIPENHIIENVYIVNKNKDGFIVLSRDKNKKDIILVNINNIVQIEEYKEETITDVNKLENNGIKVFIEPDKEEVN